MKCPKKYTLQNEIGKMGHFKKFEHKKSGHFKEKTHDLFENEK